MTDQPAPAPTTAASCCVAHTGRDEAREVARAFCQGADRRTASGCGCSPTRPPTSGSSPAVDGVEIAGRRPTPRGGCELVAGHRRRRHDPARRRADAGDAARRCSGVNLGHVGFLAEAEYDDLESTIDAIVAPPLRRRGAADPRRRPSTATARSSTARWALNEASVEKAARERMLEVVVEVDGRPLSRWGCDGVVCATPTGSTAYAFSAGGPVVWPEVEALLLVPISAHALFARPLVVAPTSVLAVEVLARTDGAGVLWCDGRRTVDLPPGARIEVRRGARAGAAGPAARRAVHRPAGGEVRPARRGVARRRRATPATRPERREAPMLEEMRITLARRHRRRRRSSSARASPWSPVRPAPARRWSSPRSGCCSAAVPTPARSAPAPSRRGSRASCASTGRRRRSPRAVDEAGGELEDGRVVLARTVSAEGRSRAFVGGASVPVAVARRARRAAGRRARPVRPAPAAAGPARSATRSTGSAATRLAGAAGDVRRAATRRLDATPSASSTRSSPTARERAQEADLLRFGLGEIEAVDPRAGRGRRRWRPRRPGSGSPTPCARAAEQAREALSSERRAAPTRSSHASRAARTLLDGVREHDPEAGRARRPAGRGRLPALRRGRRRRVVRRRPRHRPGPAGRGLRAAGGADRADPQVRRHASTRCSPGPRRRPTPAARPRRHRRADRGAARGAGGAARELAGERGAALSAARTEAGRAGSAARSPPSSPPRDAARPARCVRRSTPRRRRGSVGDAVRFPPRRRRGRAAAGRQHAAPSRARCTRARPAASSPA